MSDPFPLNPDELRMLELLDAYKLDADEHNDADQHAVIRYATLGVHMAAVLRQLPGVGED